MVITSKGGFCRPGKNRKSLVGGGGSGGSEGGGGGGDNGGGAGQYCCNICNILSICNSSDSLRLETHFSRTQKN